MRGFCYGSGSSVMIFLLDFKETIQWLSIYVQVSQEKEKSILLISELKGNLEACEDEKWKLSLELGELQKQVCQF